MSGTVVVGGATDVVVVSSAAEVVVGEPASLLGSVPHAVVARSAMVKRTTPNRRPVLGWLEPAWSVRCRNVSMRYMGRHDRPKG
jgi:hypothetical protein